MIQRIQSVFMLIASLVLGLEFVFPFAASASGGAGYLSDSVYDLFDNNILLSLIALGMLLSIVSIFLFKNRKLQTSTNWLTMILCIVIVGASYFFLYQDQSNDLEGISLGIGSGLPIISLILLFVANRFINKDESLVKSMDRLR